MKESKIKWPLILHGSSQEQTRQREKSPSTSCGETRVNINLNPLLSSELRLENGGLNNNCDISSSRTNNTIGVTCTPLFNFIATGVELAEFNNLGCKFNAVLAPTATITIVTNENKNKNIFESGPTCDIIQAPHHTPHGSFLTEKNCFQSLMRVYGSILLLLNSDLQILSRNVTVQR